MEPGLDPETLAGCTSGDPAAMDEFVRRFTALVFSTVRRVLGPNPPDPASSLEDVAQDVFLKIFRNGADLLRRFDPDRSSLPTWVALIARSVAVDAGRKRRFKFVPLDEEAIRDPSGGECKDRPHLEIPLKLLTGRQKLVLALMFDHGWDVPRIAEFLHIDEQTVRSTKHKALDRLREALSESGEVAQAKVVSKG